MDTGVKEFYLDILENAGLVWFGFMAYQPLQVVSKSCLYIVVRPKLTCIMDSSSTIFLV